MAKEEGLRVPPYDEAAEESLLGALLLKAGLLEEISNLMTPADFYKPAHRSIYGVVLDLWTRGMATDVVSVAAEFKEAGTLDRIGGAGTLVTLQSQAPSTSAKSVARYADIVVKMALYRRAIGVAEQLKADCYDMAADPNDLMEEAKANLESLGVRIGDLPSDLWQLDAYLDREGVEPPFWCIPGLIRVGWRVMVVAGEGVGKTVLFRQMAIAAAQGIHPLNYTPIEPCRTLIVDLENPEDSVMNVCTPIRERAMQKSANYDSDRAWLWHRPSGINLRERSDRVALESIINHVRPDLVCMGPLYKAYEVSARENDELAAREVMSVFDKLRTRYNFGLLLEHHAPKESGGSKRKMMPYGSSLWLRWPEIGISLNPEGLGLETLQVGRWRGDRLENAWPLKLHRSQEWPFSGEWETGTYRAQERAPEYRVDDIPDEIDPDLPF